MPTDATPFVIRLSTLIRHWTFVIGHLQRPLVCAGARDTFPFLMLPRPLFAILLTACLCARFAAGQTATSNAALKVPAQGKPGFTLLTPEQTGVAFTNDVDERAAAANRTLYNGSGAAAGDFDGDGLPDIFFCSLNGRNTLYKNLGGWRFADVTEQAGLQRDDRYYRGAVFADVNGDARLDLLVCVQGHGVLCFLNAGNGRFTDATTSARTASTFAATTLALADVDGNGTLDLYVANNRAEDIRDRGKVELQSVNGRLVVPPALRDRLVIINGQVQEYGEPDQLYLNNGKGQFAPVSWTGGRFRDEQGRPLTEAPKDWALSATFRDVNNDGAPDLYVCNDFWTPDRFWINDGKGRFRAMDLLAWRNMSASSMGVDFADVDRDGDLDFFVVDMLSRDPRLRKRQKLAQPPIPGGIGEITTRPQFMRNTLFANRGDGSYAEIANHAGVAASEWSWSPIFMDVDLDGYDDLLITSGHAKDVQDLDASALIRARQHSWKGFTNEVERQKAFTQELMEHMRLYPRLDTPVVAFRNRGGLHFEDMTGTWGTGHPGVHHAIATADFDGDGDLDFAVNNLGSAAGLYRNDSTAPRVAVRLRGLPPNTQAIGATVKLLDGAVPLQSQEVVSGGRYLAGCDPMLVFAAGKSSAMKLEITWRSGATSVVTAAAPNHSYAINEPAEGTLSRTNARVAQTNAPLFKDVSHLLQHIHREEPFNDFERQPLLPRRLSQAGPGVSWFDVDGDGNEDLLIGSGRGGRLACFRNKGNAFELIKQAAVDAIATADQTGILGWRASDGARFLVASDKFENTAAAGVQQISVVKNSVDVLAEDTPASGPLAMTDIDADGDLDLFSGGRSVPGRYPEASPSQIYRFENGQFALDTNHSNALRLVGIVNGAVWSDLTADGFPELILACEWGPIRVFKNDGRSLTAWNAAVSVSQPSTLNSQPPTLNSFTGWWTGVATGDLDGDGRLDIVAANWGLNSDYVATRERPLQLHYGDLLERGVVDLIETEWDEKDVTARRRLDVLGRELPPLQEHFASHRKFSEAALAGVVSPFPVKPKRLEVTTLASMVFFNRGDHFEAVALPAQAQSAPALGVNVADFDGDGHQDVFLSQNFFATEPETPRLDAGRGLLLRGAGAGKLEAVVAGSGIEVYGEQRASATCDFDRDGRVDLVITQNGAATKLFRNVGAKPGLRVRLQSPPDNPHGVGATLRLKDGDKLGPAQEVQAGSGYWSQNSSVLVMTPGEKPSAIVVRWPGGVESNTPLGAEREVTIVHPASRAATK
jgi:enediyne biosynthesis protein E4